MLVCSLIRLGRCPGRPDLWRAGAPRRTYLKRTPGNPNQRWEKPPRPAGSRWAWRRKFDQILIQSNIVQFVGAIGLFTLALLGLTLAVSPGFRVFFVTYRPGLAKLLGMEVDPAPRSPNPQANRTASVKRDLRDMARTTEAQPVVQDAAE